MTCDMMDGMMYGIMDGSMDDGCLMKDEALWLRGDGWDDGRLVIGAG